MKRRTFITSASVLIVGLPIAYYIVKNKNKKNPLITADVLSQFCDENTLKAIGIVYRTKVPEENQIQKLTDLILTDSSGKKIDSTNSSLIEKLVAKKIHEDFKASEIIAIKGWIISKTEARQCALFSFSNI